MQFICEKSIKKDYLVFQLLSTIKLIKEMFLIFRKNQLMNTGSIFKNMLNEL